MKKEEFVFKKVKFEDGKEAVPARERVRFARETEMDYSIQTSYEINNGWAIVKATFEVTLPSTNVRLYTGHSMMRLSAAPYNFALETAETKAIGRALAAAGIGIDDSYASADEMVSVDDTPGIATQEEDKGGAAVKEVERVLSQGAEKVVIEKKPGRPGKAPVQRVAAPVEESAQQPDNPPAKEQPAEEEQPSVVQQEKQPEKPAVAQTPQRELGGTDAMFGNPYEIMVGNIPEGKKERPFKMFFDMYSAMGGDALGAKFETISAQIIESAPELNKYENYERLLKTAPADMVNQFMIMFYDVVNS